jgi:long-chain fatty acid transport protein
VAAVAILLFPNLGNCQSLYLPGGGAAHMSMGGVSTADPVDAIGALYWNPAAIGRFGRSEAAIGAAFLFPDISLESTAPGLLGPRTGRTQSDSGVVPASSVGVVYQPDNSPLTVGMGLNTVAVGGVNYPGDVNNPILVGVGPLGNQQGSIAASVLVLQMTPTAAYKVTDRLWVGFGPMFDVAITSFDPAYFGSPDDSNRDGIGTFPTGSHSRPFWGLGFRTGLVYSVTDQIDVGFGYTSTQWFEPWLYNARTELGLPRTLKLTATLPAIYSWGVAYHPTEKLLFATDLRYFDYANAELFGVPVVDGGLGWKSVFAASFGARYQLTDRLALSAGYIYNDNPIRNVATLFNIQAPVITQNTITVGTTIALTESMSASLGYAYAFRNSLTGPVREATGFGVTMDTAAQMVTLTLQYKFGGCGCAHPAAPCADCGCSSPPPAVVDRAPAAPAPATAATAPAASASAPVGPAGRLPSVWTGG